MISVFLELKTLAILIENWRDNSIIVKGIQLKSSKNWENVKKNKIKESSISTKLREEKLVSFTAPQGYHFGSYIVIE